jgi:hypothetical protein
MIILKRALLRSGVLFAAVLMSAAFALFLVMRGPLSGVTKAQTMPNIPHIDDPNLFDVEAVILKNYNPESQQNIKVGELKGKTMITDPNGSYPSSYSAPSREQSMV